MAKRGRRPINNTIADLEPGLRDRIDEAIRSHADQSAAFIYRKFGLEGRGLVKSTFRKYVGKARKAMEQERVAQIRGLAPSAMTEEQMCQELRRRAYQEALTRMEAGDTKVYEITALLARLHDLDRIEIQRRADERAAELHEVRMNQVKKDLRKDLDERTKDGKTLTRGDVSDMIDRIMRGK